MPHDCPTCERTFDSRRGLGVDHSSVHDERLPNRTCDRCGDRFYSEYEKRYCSEVRLDASESYAGENYPNYRGGTEKTTCEICDAAFEYYPSEKPGKFCTDCVETEKWRASPALNGERNPNWNGGMIELDCDVCGASIRRYPSDLTGDYAFCSSEC